MPNTSLRDSSLRDAARSLQLLRSTASSGHRATRTLSTSAQCPRPNLKPPFLFQGFNQL
ncbi:MAG: hypothetical protein ACYTXA_09570 [Nostoc sp.]